MWCAICWQLVQLRNIKPSFSALKKKKKETDPAMPANEIHIVGRHARMYANLRVRSQDFGDVGTVPSRR